MREYTIHVESPQLDPNGDVRGDVLDLAQAYLSEAEPDAGAACLLDHDRGVLSATMQITAHAAGAAADRAIELFYGALEAAGFDVNLPGWRLQLEITPGSEIAA